MVDLLLSGCLNVAFWGGIWTIVTRSSPREWIDDVLATSAAAFATVIISLEVLGFAALIGRGPVATICLAIGALGLLMRRRGRRPARLRLRPASPARAGSASRTWPALVAVGLATCAALLYLLLGLVLPVEPVSDAPIYHLPFAIRWWRTGALGLVPTPFGDMAATYFPANGELWLTWLLALGSTGPLVKVAQWPFLLVGAVAIYGLAKRARVPSSSAVFPAACWVCLPLVLTQSNLANIDLIWSAFYLSAVYWLVRWLEKPPADAAHPLFFFALSCGIVVGAKAVGAVFVMVLLVPMVVTLGRRPWPLRHLAVLAAGLLIPSGYWYLRNIWIAGNPLYPLQLSLFGRVLADGWYPREAMDAAAYHVPVREWPFFLGRLALVSGGAGFALVIAGMATGGIQVLRSSADPRARRVCALSVVLALAHLGIYWFFVPYNTQERFIVPALGLALVPLSIICAASRARQVVCCILLAWQLLGVSIGPQRGWWTLVRAYGNPLLEFYPSAGFAASLLPGWEVLERHASSTGETIAYTGTNLPYYLRGIGLRHEVEYINVNRRTDWLLHDYHRGLVEAGTFRPSEDPFPQWYRAMPDFDAWVANLRRRGVDFVFIARENRHGQLEKYPGTLPPFPIERAWADRHPELFEDLGPFQYAPGTIPWVRVYRVIHGPAS